jgi:hypothetical protein
LKEKIKIERMHLDSGKMISSSMQMLKVGLEKVINQISGENHKGKAFAMNCGKSARRLAETPDKNNSESLRKMHFVVRFNY